MAAGIFTHAAQRPSQLLPRLLAKPWHVATEHPALCALLAAKDAIREEALELLQIDAAARKGAKLGKGAEGFASYLSAVLSAGDWADVGLYYNGRQNVNNAPRAPRTSKLLSSSIVSDCF